MHGRRDPILTIEEQHYIRDNARLWKHIRTLGVRGAYDFAMRLKAIEERKALEDTQKPSPPPRDAR